MNKSNEFGKSFRLQSGKDFQHLKKGASFSRGSCVRFFSKSSRIQSSNTRLGLSVSKKCGKAVTRNRLKRILREEFRRSDAKELGLDVLAVVLSRKNQDIPFEQYENRLLKDFNRQLQKL